MDPQGAGPAIHRAWVEEEAPAGAVHADIPGILDTFEYFGKGTVDLRGHQSGAIDERNLTACRRLWLGESAVQRLNTQLLRNLAHLNIWETGITELDARPLRDLQKLDMDGTQVSSLDTSGLGSLRELYASRTKLSSLDTRPLISLRVISVGETPIRFLDTRPMRRLKVLRILNTQVKFVGTAGLESLRGLDIENFQISRVHIVAGWRIEYLWIDGSGIRFIDGRARMQVKELFRGGDQTVLHDEYEEEEDSFEEEGE